VTKSAKYKALKGMPDIFPLEASIRRVLEKTAREVFRTFAFNEIRTPILEETKVFTRSIGEETDIVEKEMYSFSDRGGKQISLRPEGTASIIRAYVECGWYGDCKDIAKFYYIGPMFRGERPQKGRLRQFHQIGAEIIGSSNPYVDAELIISLKTLLDKTKIKGFTILLNSMGCNKDRDSYKKALKSYLVQKTDDLCEACKRRSKTNVLRVLDCKRDACKSVVKKAPVILDYLCSDCIADYTRLKEILSEMKVSFKEKPDLVRGLDYYTGIVFEAIHPDLGAQDAIAAGGRYDNLVKEMGGPSVGATGYAVGIERLLLLVKYAGIHGWGLNIPEVVVIPTEEKYRQYAFNLMCKFWQKDIPCEMDNMGRSFKGQMRRAHKNGVQFVAIIGEDEANAGTLVLKHMKDGEQKTVSFEEAAKKVNGI